MIAMGFGSKCSIFSEQVVYMEKENWNIADMRLVSLDHVTFDIVPMHIKNVSVEKNRTEAFSHLRFYRVYIDIICTS